MLCIEIVKAILACLAFHVEEIKMASYRKKRHVETDTDSTAQLEEPSVQSNSESDDEESSGDDSEIEGEAMDAEIHEVYYFHRSVTLV